MRKTDTVAQLVMKALVRTIVRDTVDEEWLRGRYMLVERQPVPAWEKQAWEALMKSPAIIVAVDWIRRDVRVSTVFMGRDAFAQDGRPPELFETAVFVGEVPHWRTRYTTWADAEAGHARVCFAVRDGDLPAGAGRDAVPCHNCAEGLRQHLVDGVGPCPVCGDEAVWSLRRAQGDARGETYEW